jgi:hypothetical protein
MLPELSVKDLFESSTLCLYDTTVKYKYPDSSCSVCLIDFENKDIIRILRCHHKFCHKCIDRWLCTNHYCPMCKESLKYVEHDSDSDSDDTIIAD